MKQNYSDKVNAFIAEEKAATQLISSVSNLLYKQGVELVLFRKHLLDKNVSEILRIHQYASNFVKKPISIFNSTQLAHILTTLNLPPAKIDIGRLTYEYDSEKSHFKTLEKFLEAKIGFMQNAANNNLQSKDVVLFGFGRIGRLCARELIKQAGKGQQLRLKAIVVRRLTDAQIIIGLSDHVKNNINILQYAKRNDTPLFTIQDNSASQITQILSEVGNLKVID